jgi:hypothetical protein
MEARKPKKSSSYQASFLYVVIFYGMLLAWVAVSVLLLGSKAQKAGWAVTQLLMIAFVLGYTWYFSLGISYKIRVEEGGEIELTSFRRVLRIKARDIDLIEGPRFGLPIGFIRFRLAREKAYLFCVVSSNPLKKVLWEVKALKPGVKVRYLVIERP